MKNRVEKYIEFKKQPHIEGKKTERWLVVTRKNMWVSGEIKWWGAWRKYVFFPSNDALFDKDCLRLIADFCEQKTKEPR